MNSSTAPLFVQVVGGSGNSTSNVTITGPLGQTVMASSVPVVIASDQTVLPVIGNKTSNAVVPDGNNLGALVAIANVNPPTYGEGNQTLLSTDLTGRLRVVGTKNNNSATPTGNLGVMPSIANAASPTLGEGNQTCLSTDLAGNLRVTTGNVTTQPGTLILTGTGLATNDIIITATDVSTYLSASVQLECNSTVMSNTRFQGSNDNSNWHSVSLVATSSGSITGPTNTPTVTGIYQGPISTRYFRTITLLGNGNTTTGTAIFKTGGISPQTLGGRVSIDETGIVTNYIDGSNSTTGNGTVQLLAAAGANTSNMINTLTIANSNATGTTVQLLGAFSGSAGNITLPCPGNSGAVITFPTAWKGASNTAVSFQVAANTTTVYLSAVGYTQATTLLSN
jgi:hypothetical protein